MLSYRDALEGLYSLSLARFTASSDRAGKIAQRTAEGQWGTSAAQDLIPLDGAEATGVRERLIETEAAFRARVEALLGDLAYCTDADMRCLGVGMNFNDVYKVARRKRKT